MYIGGHFERKTDKNLSRNKISKKLYKCANVDVLLKPIVT